MKPEMKTFVIYEVWTRSFVAQAESVDDALRKYEPLEAARRSPDLSLCNWHAVEAKVEPKRIGLKVKR